MMSFTRWSIGLSAIIFSVLCHEWKIRSSPEFLIFIVLVLAPRSRPRNLQNDYEDDDENEADFITLPSRRPQLKPVRSHSLPMRSRETTPRSRYLPPCQTCPAEFVSKCSSSTP